VAQSLSLLEEGQTVALLPKARKPKERGRTMLFEVLFDGKVRATTEHPECIPERNTLREMEGAGYAFRVNGKRCKAKDVAAVTQG
jgi:hypothetical protein